MQKHKNDLTTRILVRTLSKRLKMICERIVFKRPKEVAIEETEVPNPSPNQVLIKTLVTLMSTGTELTILSGEFPKGSMEHYTI